MTAAAGLTLPASYFVLVLREGARAAAQQLAGLDLREAETFLNGADFFPSDFDLLLRHTMTIMMY